MGLCGSNCCKKSEKTSTGGLSTRALIGSMSARYLRRNNLQWHKKFTDQSTSTTVTLTDTPPKSRNVLTGPVISPNPEALSSLSYISNNSQLSKDLHDNCRRDIDVS
eukprot:369149_1